MDSILNTVKKLLGIHESDTNFDDILIVHINSVFSILNQLGVGPAAGYSITNSSNVWSEFSTDPIIKDVQSYVYLKVKIMFDPPQHSAGITSLEKVISELESRLNYAVDPEV